MTQQETIEQWGFQILPGILDEDQVLTLREVMESYGETMPSIGIRMAEKKIPEVAELAEDQVLLHHVESVLGPKARLARAIVFDKSAGKNWLVPWHQDQTVILKERALVEGWGPWSVKEGVLHAEAPIECLNQMITLRIHLDDADEKNGCLRMIPGSHLEGKLKNSDIYRLTREIEPVDCIVEAGDVLMMRPHLLHASSRAVEPTHRRVIHLEYAAFDLPSPLEWG